MKNFSFARMWQVLCYSFESAPRREFRRVLACLMCCLFFLVIPYIVSDACTPHPLTTGQLHSSAVLAVVAFVFYAMLNISEMGEVFKSKKERIAILMLPATMGEKFVVQLIRCTLYPMVLFCLSFVAADLLFNALVFVIHPCHTCPGICFPLFFESIRDFGINLTYTDNGYQETLATSWLIILVALAFTFLHYCFYLLGGLVFSRRPFVMTAVTQLVISILVGTMLGSALEYIDILFQTLYGYRRVVGYFFLVVLVMGVVAEVWLAYHLFVKVTVVKNRKFGI